MYSLKHFHHQSYRLAWALVATLAFTLQVQGQEVDQCAVGAEGKAIHYCNLNDDGDGPGGAALKIGPFPGDRGVAQRFKVGEAGNVCAVTIGLARVGTPEGSMIASIREIDPITGNPGDLVGTLGEVEIKTLPKVIWGSLPKLFEGVTIEGEVADLTLGKEYYLHLVHTDDFIARGGPSGPTDVWFVDLVPTPQDAEHAIVEWADPPSIPSPEWGTDWPNLRLRARIEGKVQDVAPTAPLIIATIKDGNVTADPDLDEYPVGSEVTVTATPEPGFEFVQWTYGDQEFTTNPATITVTAGATLTSVFATVEPETKPIDTEILPAMAIRWDSEVGEAYEVQSSFDLQNWTSEATNVEGTGETMTHFFIRDAQEMYYRVLESE